MTSRPALLHPTATALVLVLGGLLILLSPSLASADPVQPTRMIAEWEPAWGVLIRWPLNIPVELVREISEDDTVYTLVEGAGSENNARMTFQGAGVVMDHVRFIQTAVYSSWTRDWGPQCIFDGDGQMGITDPWFDGYPWVPGCSSRGEAGEPARPERARGYEEDDVIPGDVAAFLGVPHHLMQAYCTGGNIMTDGFGRAFSTEQMLAENAPYMSAPAFFSEADEYLGINDYQILSDPEVHGIQHIDCYAKLLDEETVLVKELPTWHPEYHCVETLVDEFEALDTCYGRAYRIVRIWCEPYSGNDAAGYTNSLIINRKVLVPTFGLAADADALATYADAMPGYEVIGFTHSNWYSYDALHCRTMGIFDAGMLRMTHARLPDVVPPEPVHEVVVTIRPMSGTGLVPGEQVVRWRLEGAGSWNEEPLAPARGDTFAGYIPRQTPGDVVEYYVSARDSIGRSESLPRTAPAGYYSFQVDPLMGVDGGEITAAPSLALAASPSPFTAGTTLSYTLERPSRVRLSVHDVAGRLVAVLVDGLQEAGPHEVAWSGDALGRAPSGVYFARLAAGNATAARRIVLLR